MSSLLLDLNGIERIGRLMLQTKGSQDFLEGTTDEVVEWRMLNMDSELITASLSRTIGPGIHSTLSPHWNSNAKRGDGVVPLNNILRFETFRRALSIGDEAAAGNTVTTGDNTGRERDFEARSSGDELRIVQQRRRLSPASWTRRILDGTNPSACSPGST